MIQKRNEDFPRLLCVVRFYKGIRSKYKEMYGNIEVTLYRVMSMFKLKIIVNLPQLLYIVVSAAENGVFERFGGFCVDCYYTL